MWPHLLRGRPVLVTTISVALRLTTAVRVVVQVVVGLGRRDWRIGWQVVVGLPVGELVLEGLSDQAAHPGRDVDGFLRAESVELAPHLGVDAEADGGFWWHAAMLR